MRNSSRRSRSPNAWLRSSSVASPPRDASTLPTIQRRFCEPLQMWLHVVGRPEMRQEHRLRPQCGDPFYAAIHNSRSKSGGGVGGTTAPPLMRIAAVSPTNAMPLDGSK